MTQLWLSIIIPVYGVEKYIQKCLDSIVKDNADAVSGIEVLVIDDGSKDRSGEIADKYALQYPFIQVIHKQNAGVAAARNTGIQHARGEWLYFMDSDDWMEKGAVGKINQVTLRQKDCDLLLFDAWKNTGEKESQWEHFEEEKIWSDTNALRLLQRGVLYFPNAQTHTPLAAPWDKVYKRAFVQEKGVFFIEKLKVLDDMIFNMKVLGVAKKISYHKIPIYHYRYVPDSITNSYKPDRIAQDMEVWDTIQTYINEQVWEAEEQEAFLQAYYCRIVKSFSICCRLCFFHKQNKKRLTEKLTYVNEVLESNPYKTAFRKVSIRNAEWKLKTMILFGRGKCAIGIWLLHLGQSLLCRVS